MTGLDAGLQPWFEDLKTKKAHLGSFFKWLLKKPQYLCFGFLSEDPEPAGN